MFVFVFVCYLYLYEDMGILMKERMNGKEGRKKGRGVNKKIEWKFILNCIELVTQNQQKEK